MPAQASLPGGARQRRYLSVNLAEEDFERFKTGGTHTLRKEDGEISVVPAEEPAPTPRLVP